MTFHREITASSMHPLSRIVALVMSLWLLFTALPAHAVSLIRDPDIEYSLNKLAAPILRAAGLGGNVKILVVNDQSLNAFVLDTNHIFIHIGLLMRLDTPEMLQSVIAHEAAHITNGHIARRITNMGSAQTAAGLGLALAVAAAAASGNSQVGLGLALGTQSSAQRRFFAHTRAEEHAADQTGIRYLASAGINPQGAVDVFKIFEGQEALNISRQDPYARTHPLTRDRIRALRAFVAAYQDKSQKTSPDAIYWHARARAKASAFTRAPKWTLRRAASSPSKDIRLMREAVAYHRLSQTSKALGLINEAIALRPNDPWFYELRGQILLENRRFADAVASYRKAVQLAPNDALCLASLGHALLAAQKPKEALKMLEKSRNKDFRNSRMLRDLGAAYARTGQNGQASLATAERYALQGRLKDAEIHAKRASGLLPRGSRGWLRAEDILVEAKRARKK